MTSGGFSLQNRFVYTFWSEEGEVLCFPGRDPRFEQLVEEFEQTPPDKREAAKRPMKHKYSKGFQRGIEFFGQQKSRLEERPEYREFLMRYGLILVEGFNDVIGLDNLDVYSEGICSNHFAEAQIPKAIRRARELAGGKVALFLDCDEAGENGTKDAVWQLMEAGLDVRIVWSLNMYGGAFVNRQPESLQQAELYELLKGARTRTVSALLPRS